MGITIAATADALNTHQRVYQKQLLQKIKQGTELENDLKPVITTHSWVAPNVSVTEIVQPYQSQFTPKGDYNFDAEEYSLFRGKIDHKFSADDLDKFFDSWMAEWVEDGKPREEWTFPRYIWEEVIVPQIIEDLELKVAYSGEYSAPTPGTPGNAAEMADGLHTVVKAGITAGDITPIATGALLENTMVNQVESFCDGIPEPYTNLPGTIMMSKSNARKFYRNYRELFGTGNGVGNNENSELKVDNTNKVVKGYACMEGSDRIIFAPSTVRNFVVGYRRGAPRYPVIRFQEQDRDLKVLGEFHRFYGYSYAGYTFVNDQV